MKKKSASQFAFYNLRFLIPLCVGVLLALVGLGIAAARPAQVKAPSKAATGAPNIVPPDLSRAFTSPTHHPEAHPSRALFGAFSDPLIVETSQVWFWQNPLPQGNPLDAVSFSDSSTGTAVGINGTILRTTDGGSTWTAQSSGAAFPFGVSFIETFTYSDAKAMRRSIIEPSGLIAQF